MAMSCVRARARVYVYVCVGTPNLFRVRRVNRVLDCERVHDGVI